LRNKGAIAIGNAIFGEDSLSRVRTLYIKSNFIGDKSFKEIVRLMIEKFSPLSDLSKFHLKGLFIAGNDTSLFELKRL